MQLIKVLVNSCQHSLGEPINELWTEAAGDRQQGNLDLGIHCVQQLDVFAQRLDRPALGLARDMNNYQSLRDFVIPAALTVTRQHKMKMQCHV